MSIWVDWAMVAISLALIGVGLRDRQHGGRLALVAAMLLATSVARLLPDSAPWLRAGAWLVAIALMVYMLATTSKETYRKTRVELSLWVAAIAVIWILQLADLPRSLTIALLVVLVILVAAAPLLALARHVRRGV